MEFFMKDVEEECEDTYNSIGNLYKNGYGVGQDYKEALIWYEKTAENSSDDDQLNLGIMYL
jgi:TPR repeat protein